MATMKKATKKTAKRTTRKPAKPATTPRAAKGGKASGKAPAKGTPATRANRGAGTAKPAGKGKSPTPTPTSKRLSALDAAAEVLAQSGKQMGTREMIEVMGKQGLWTSPGGRTPHATLYSAITREIAAKGRQSRFKKTGKGVFAANGKRG